MCPLEALEEQVRAVALPHVAWAPAPFIKLVDDPAPPCSRLRVMCLLKDSNEATVGQVEAALLALQHGNHAAVSSIAFRGYSAC